MRISDWSSDVCSSDLGRIHIDHEGNGGVERSEFGAADRLRIAEPGLEAVGETQPGRRVRQDVGIGLAGAQRRVVFVERVHGAIGSGNAHAEDAVQRYVAAQGDLVIRLAVAGIGRSEEHTSELQSLMRISYAVFCLKKK